MMDLRDVQYSDPTRYAGPGPYRVMVGDVERREPYGNTYVSASVSSPANAGEEMTREQLLAAVTGEKPGHVRAVYVLDVGHATSVLGYEPGATYSWFRVTHGSREGVSA